MLLVASVIFSTCSSSVSRPASSCGGGPSPRASVRNHPSPPLSPSFFAFSLRVPLAHAFEPQHQHSHVRLEELHALVDRHQHQPDIAHIHLCGLLDTETCLSPSSPQTPPIFLLGLGYFCASSIPPLPQERNKITVPYTRTAALLSWLLEQVIKRNVGTTWFLLL